MLNKNKTAKVKFRIRLQENTEVKVIGYNEIADYCFNKLREKEFVAIDGCIRDKNIEIKNIEMFETFSNFKC